MSRPKEIINEQLAAEAQLELAKHTDHKVCQRLQAVAGSYANPIKQVAAVMSVSSRCVWCWIKAFKERGAAGLQDRPRGQKAQVRQWLREGRNRRGQPVRWTLRRLAAEIAEAFGVSISLNPPWKMVHKMGFRQKVPRPRHAKTDPKAQAAFKKNRARRKARPPANLFL
jgi:transposase